MDENTSKFSKSSILDRIYEALPASGYRAADICHALEIRTSTMSTWKTRKRNPPAEYLPTIADMLGVSLDWLVRGHEQTKVSDESETEKELLELFRSLPERQRYEYLGELKGYVRAFADSVKYDDIEKRELA